MTEPVIRNPGGGEHLISVGALMVPPGPAVPPRRGLSRRVRQRLLRAQRVQEAVADSMAALNLLGNFTAAPTNADTALFSEKVQTDLEQMHADNHPPPGFAVQEAACALLGSDASPYVGGADDGSQVVPYARQWVSWPRQGASAKWLSHYMPADLWRQYDGTDRAWARPRSGVKARRKEEGAARLYHDVVLL